MPKTNSNTFKIIVIAVSEKSLNLKTCVCECVFVCVCTFRRMIFKILKKIKNTLKIFVVRKV